MATGDVIDVTPVALVEAHQANSGSLAQWDVDKALGAVTHVTTLGLTAIEAVSARELIELGLIGHDANRTRLRVGAEGRALRAGQYFDPVDVINVRVEVGPHQRDGLLIQIHRNRRVGTEQALATTRNTANVDATGAWAQGDKTDVRKHHQINFHISHVQVGELGFTQHRYTHRNVLNALGATSRCYQHLFQAL